MARGLLFYYFLEIREKWISNHPQKIINFPPNKTSGATEQSNTKQTNLGMIQQYVPIDST
jgi:hypothetical protein